jgi:CrcB protein
MADEPDAPGRTSGHGVADPGGAGDVHPRVPGSGPLRADREWDVLGAIAMGGSLGALGRYAVGEALPHAPGSFPWSTLLVNVSGCLLIGVLMVVALELTEPHRLVRPFLGVGVLGGYTTFSAASVELQQLLDAHRDATALAYLLATPAGALIAAWAGLTLARAGGIVRTRTGLGGPR